MSSFGKWLKKNRWDFEAHDSPGGAEITEYECDKGRFVPVEGFGEWAWEEITTQWQKRDWVRWVPKFLRVGTQEDTMFEMLCEVAVACLGEAEVERRLKGVVRE